MFEHPAPSPLPAPAHQPSASADAMGSAEPLLQLRTMIPAGQAVGEWVYLAGAGELVVQIEWSPGEPLQLHICDERHTWLAVDQPRGSHARLSVPALPGWYFVAVDDPAGATGRMVSLTVWPTPHEARRVA